jgi:hypothetical protein
MTYLVVEAQSAKELQEKVQKYITEGWEPVGGIAVAKGWMEPWRYCQAMVMRGGQ